MIKNGMISLEVVYLYGKGHYFSEEDISALTNHTKIAMQCSLQRAARFCSFFYIHSMGPGEFP